jgi:hypothetical protein
MMRIIIIIIIIIINQLLSKLHISYQIFESNSIRDCYNEI